VTNNNMHSDIASFLDALGKNYTDVAWQTANSKRNCALISSLSQQFKILNYLWPCTDDSLWETKLTSAYTHM
jgi:hypothetical protein